MNHYYKHLCGKKKKFTSAYNSKWSYQSCLTTASPPQPENHISGNRIAKMAVKLHLNTFI